MRIDRTFALFVDPRITDRHLLAALAGPGRAVVSRQHTLRGTLYQVFGYAPVLSGGRPVVIEDLEGRRVRSLLLIAYLDEDDAGLLARITFALEADEEDFGAYG